MTETETLPGSSQSTQQYGYDQVGNRWLASGTPIDPLTPTANGYDGYNHLNTLGYTDGRGNVNQNGGYAYQYDAENRLTSSTMTVNGSPIAATYTYDGEGRRVMKQYEGTTTHYVYDPAGNLSAEYTVAGTPPSAPCTTCYVMADQVGSIRMLTDSGANQAQLCDYAPFGEELTGYDGRADVRWCGNTNNALYDNGLHFTGKERDSETGLDYFGFRYFSGAQGRWTSPDEPLADQDPANPQSWNLYGYVRNNPLVNIDPTGQDCITTSNQTNTSVSVSVTSGTCGSGGGAYVPGAVDTSSLTYNGTSIGYSYTPYDTNSLQSAGTVQLGSGPSDALSPYAQEFYNQMSARTASSNHMIAEFGAAQVGFAGAYVGTYAGPAIWGALTAAGGEAGFLKFGNKGFELVRDFQGRIHGDLPEFVPKDATRDELEVAAQELKQSLEVRQQAMQQLGALGNHGLRIAQEQRLLYQIEQRLGKR